MRLTGTTGRRHAPVAPRPPRIPSLCARQSEPIQVRGARGYRGLPLMTLQIGDALSVTPVAQNPDRTWIARFDGLADGWGCVLHRRDSSAIREQVATMAKVVWIDQAKKLIEVAVSRFGRLPVSDRMRPRYLKAGREILAILRGASELSQGAAGSLSEVKGLLNRCIRHDQPDWVTVYELFGRPTFDELSVAASLLAEISRSVRAGEAQSSELLPNLRATRLADLLDRFEQNLAQESVTLGSNRVEKRHGRSPEKVDAVETRVLSSYEKQKLTDATAAHQTVLQILNETLTASGHVVETNVFIDAFTRLKSGPAVFEAKSVTGDNELSQIRAAISQLYEYRFRHRLRRASLWIVLSAPPSEEWIHGYLEDDRDIRLLWIEDGRVAGPSADRLFERGSVARKSDPRPDRRAK